jgi:hypothetical protein
MKELKRALSDKDVLREIEEEIRNQQQKLTPKEKTD